MGFSLQTWRYIGWVNEDELKDQEGCADRPSPPQAAATVYYLSAVHLDAAHSFVSQLNGTILPLHFIEKKTSRSGLQM